MASAWCASSLARQVSPAAAAARAGQEREHQDIPHAEQRRVAGSLVGVPAGGGKVARGQAGLSQVELVHGAVLGQAASGLVGRLAGFPQRAGIPGRPGRHGQAVVTVELVDFRQASVLGDRDARLARGRARD